jgi:hypothetical protein
METGAGAMMTTEPSSGFAVFILAGLRVATAKAKMTALEIEAVAAALAGGLIDVEVALTMAADAGVLDLLPSSTVASTA